MGDYVRTVESYCEKLTIEQLHRFHRKTTDRIYHLFAGGTMFFVDWSTLHMCHPGLAVVLDIVRKVQSRRK